MSHTWRKQAVKVLGVMAALAIAGPMVAKADDDCNSCGCQRFHCPQTKVCTEGPPNICFQQGCGKPIINPCNQPNWGYYQPCWTPWPWPPDWRHCPVRPPASMIIPPGPFVTHVPPSALIPSAREPQYVLPPPRNVDR